MKNFIKQKYPPLKLMMTIAFSLPYTIQAAIPCKSAENSQAFFECSENYKKDSDASLNISYKNLEKRIATQYTKAPDLKASLTKKLEDSQKTWTILRDSECEIEAFIIETGTLAYETAINTCNAERSTTRIQYLDSLFPD